MLIGVITLFMAGCRGSCERNLAKKNEARCAYYAACGYLEPRFRDEAHCADALGRADHQVCKDVDDEGCRIDRAAVRECIDALNALAESCPSEYETPSVCYANYTHKTGTDTSIFCDGGPDSILD